MDTTGGKVVNTWWTIATRLLYSVSQLRYPVYPFPATRLKRPVSAIHSPLILHLSYPSKSLGLDNGELSQPVQICGFMLASALSPFPYFSPLSRLILSFF